MLTLHWLCQVFFKVIEDTNRSLHSNWLAPTSCCEQSEALWLGGFVTRHFPFISVGWAGFAQVLFAWLCSERVTATVLPLTFCCTFLWWRWVLMTFARPLFDRLLLTSCITAEGRCSPRGWLWPCWCEMECSLAPLFVGNLLLTTQPKPSPRLFRTSWHESVRLTSESDFYDTLLFGFGSNPTLCAHPC